MSSLGANGRGRVDTLANIAVMAMLVWLMICTAGTGYLYFTKAAKSGGSGVLGMVTMGAIVLAFVLAVLVNPSPERWRLVTIVSAVMAVLIYFGTGTAKAGDIYGIGDFVGAVGVATFLTVSLLYLRMAKPSQAAAVVASDSANGS